ncbi:MAG: NosD domain-containing protein [Promethearchaeota archaeon]
MRKAGLLLASFVLLLSVVSQLNISPVSASSTVYIRSNGSIDPLTAPISSTDNVTYTLTSDMNATEIVVERDHIILDGADHSVVGPGDVAVDLSDRTNVTVRDLHVLGFFEGIYLSSASYCRVYRCNISSPGWRGIELYGTYHCDIRENCVVDSSFIGIDLSYCDKCTVVGNTIAYSSFIGLTCVEMIEVYNRIYYNNFLENNEQVSPGGFEYVWDNGYPEGGNYWSDYNGIDLYSGPFQNETGSDGIGDTPYSIGSYQKDRYPRMTPWSPRVQNLNTYAYYNTIQAAINAANEGDTILVRNGTYYENVIMNKSASLLGESAIIQGNSIGTGIIVVANEVTIRGFVITGDDLGINYGIHLNGALNCTISGNQILPFNEGVLLSNSSNGNDILGNIVDHQEEGSFAISTLNSSYNEISGNQGGWKGIRLSQASHNIVFKQYIGGSLSLYLTSSFNNIISDSIMDSPHSIMLLGSPNNTICGNDIHGEVLLNNASNNRFYHNNMEPFYTIQNETPNSTNIWDNGCEGNYWSDYVDRYPNASWNLYGIWNTSYVINGSDMDRYPLRNLYWNPADVNHDLIVNIFDIVLPLSATVLIGRITCAMLISWNHLE